MDNYEQVPAVIHVHTVASGGKYTASEIAHLAQAGGVRAVLFSDKAERTLTYGIPPFRGVARVTMQRPSVPMAKVGDYLKMIDEAQAANPGIILVPGMEVAPYYRWEGDVRAGNLTLYETDCEMLVYGLKKPSDWQHMPFISNPNSARFSAGSFAEFALCAALFIIGVAAFFVRVKRKFKVGLWRKQQIYYHTRPLRPFGALAVFAALLLCCFGYPFRHYPYSQYQTPRPPSAPYRLIANYVSSQGGMTVWAHPETRLIQRFKAKRMLPGLFARLPFIPKNFSAEVHNTGCVEELKATGGFTAFSSIYEGFREVGCAGCVWDKSLYEYATGQGRAAPYWTVAERDYYGVNDNFPITNSQTVFLVREFSREGILEALRAGRMYAAEVGNGTALRLKGFAVETGGGAAVSGETIAFAGPARVTGTIGSEPGRGVKIRAKLIRNGKIARLFYGRTPLKFDFVYPRAPESGKDYYRIEADNYGFARLISNPIFVKNGVGP
jgi:hypothetical protein